MQGITHLYRQHAIDKQISVDGWRNVFNDSLSSESKNIGMNSDSSASSSDSSSNKSGTPWTHGKNFLSVFVCIYVGVDLGYLM